MTPGGRYPIRAAARLTGLSVDTLRAWERRYGVVEPARGDRGRVYTDRHIDRLKQLAGLVEHGHAIGTIAGLSDAALLRLSGNTRPSRPALARIDIEPLVAAMKGYELEAIEAHLSRLAVVLSPQAFVLSVVIPALHEIGTRWEAGSVRPAQEHLVSAILRSVLGGMLRAMPRRDDAPRVVFATLSGERHELGLLSAAVLAAAAGAHAIYLGPDLPAADLAHAVSKSGASALVLAATASTSIDRNDLDALKRVPQDVGVWVGGPAADTVKAALGARVERVPSLDAIQGLVHRLAA